MVGPEFDAEASPPSQLRRARVDTVQAGTVIPRLPARRVARQLTYSMSVITQGRLHLFPMEKMTRDLPMTSSRPIADQGRWLIHYPDASGRVRLRPPRPALVACSGLAALADFGRTIGVSSFFAQKKN